MKLILIICLIFLCFYIYFSKLIGIKRRNFVRKITRMFLHSFALFIQIEMFELFHKNIRISEFYCSFLFYSVFFSTGLIEVFMKKLVSAFAILSASSLFATPVFADVAASSTAKWDATATKDTTSMLVVTPLKSLNFQYAEGLKQFNTQTGAFDVTIQGQSGATDFQLSSKLISNTLTRGDNASTLDVGVMWNGTALSKTTETTLVDTANGISAGLDALADAAIYAGSGRNSAQGDFTFKIESATSDGLTTAQYEDLADGVWDGEVAVQFNANWTTP